MKIHCSLKICLITLVCTFILATNTNAFFFLPPGPLTPTVDIAADAGGATKAGGDVVTSGIEKVQQTINTQIDKIKSFGDKIQSKIDEAKDKINDIKKQAQNWIGDKLGKITGALHKKEKGDSVIASARTIQESEVYDISSEESIVTAFEELFGTYPVEYLEKYPLHQEGIMKKYEDKAVEFSNDAMIELHIAVRSLDERMKVIEDEIKGMPDKYVVGDASSTSSSDDVGGEASEANDDLGSWQNYYHVSAIYDSVVRITEELSALEAQYEAAQAMRGGIIPIDPRKEEAGEDGGDKEASNNIYFEIPLTEKTSFAQEAVDNSGIKLTNLKITNPAWEYTETQPRVAKSPFHGAADKFQDMADIKALSLELNKAIVAHNLKQRLHTYKGPFVEYNRMKELHEKAIEALANSNGAVVSYLGRYYNNPIEAWFGKGCKLMGTKVTCNANISATRENLKNLTEGDMLCEDDKTKICSSYGVNRYEKLGGLSGHAISAYKEAKVEKTLEVTEDDFVVNVNESVDIKKPAKLDDDVTTSTSTKSKEDMEKAEAQNNDEQATGADGRSMVKPSKEVELEENEREMEILPWQIGAEVSKKIGVGMSNGKSDAYGTFKKKFMLWSDEIFFYDEYLKNKYTNMEVYIQNLNLGPIALDVANAIVAEITGKIDTSKKIPITPCEEEDEEKCWQQDPTLYVRGVEVSELVSYLDAGLGQIEPQLPKTVEEKAIYNLRDTLQAAIDAKKNEFAVQKEALEVKIANAYQKLDDLNVALNDAKKLYNATMEEYTQAKSKIGGEDKMIEISNNRKKKSKHIKDRYAIQSEQNKVKLAAQAVELAKKLEQLKKDIESKQKGMDIWEDAIDEAKSDIIKLKNDYAEMISKLEYNKETQLTSAYNVIRNKENINLGRYVSPSTAMKGLIFTNVVSIADSAVAQAKSNAIKAIQDGYIQIKELRGEAYDPDNHGQIVSIHKNIMEKIKNPPISLSAGLLEGYIPLESIKKAVVEALAKAIYNEICQGGACLVADTQYFVGLAPQQKDFAAPKNINESYTPPAREIVHFDSVDFDAINLNQDNLYVIKDAMLGYGYDMPPIWKTLLEDKGFVDRGVNIISHLTREPIESFERPGRYPCTIDNYTVDDCGFITLHKKDNKYGKCEHIKKVKVKNLFGKYYITVYYKDGGVHEDDQVADPANSTVNPRCGTSELAYFVHYPKQSTDGLKFSYILEDTLDYLNNLDGEKMKKDSEKAKKYIAEERLYNKNQIGDYLGFVEYEQEYQKTLDQLNVKVNEARDDIIAELEEFDYTPKVGFDLSVDKDYQEVEQHIEKAKNDIVKRTCSVVKSMNPNNDILREQLAKLKGVCDALEQDKEELVSLSDNMSGGAELEEKIKTERTDRAAQKAHDDEVAAAHEEKLSDFPAPYYSSY